MENRRPVFYYDPVYTDGLSVEARFPRTRYRDVREAFSRRGLELRADIRPSPLCAREDLLLVHDARYVDAFLRGHLDPRLERRIGLRPWTELIVERTRKILGGSIAATQALLGERRPITGNLAGGTHHAFRDEGAGYCVFNDIAVCARVAQRDFAVHRVLVIDLDVHQGDGTALLFRDDPRVFTFSIHCAENYPFRKQRGDLDIALPHGTQDAAYLASLDEVLENLFLRHRPGLVIYQAGVDLLAEDKLGRFELTAQGLRARNARVYATAGRWKVPVLVLMGGGYADPIGPTVEALADVFEQAIDAAQTR